MFFKNVWTETNNDNLLTWASATAYSWLFALFPFFLMLMSLLPYLPAKWKTSARDYTHKAVYELPHEAADTIWSNIEPKLEKLLNRPPRGLFSIGLIVTLWSASSGIAATMYALDKCYDVKEPRSFIGHRLVAIGLTVIVVIMILGVLILVPIGSIITNLAQWWIRNHPAIQRFLPLLIVWQILRYLIGLVLMFGVVAILYRYGPRVKPRTQAIVPGAIFCVAVWIILGIFFRIYIDRFGKYNETYGTVGGVAILLFLFYVDAVVLLMGAEINNQVDRMMGDTPQLPPAPPGSVPPAEAGPA